VFEEVNGRLLRGRETQVEVALAGRCCKLGKETGGDGATMHSRRKARIDDVSRVRSSSKGAELQKAESGAKDRRSMNV
jgi:hypothetical protein